MVTVIVILISGSTPPRAVSQGSGKVDFIPPQ